MEELCPQVGLGIRRAIEDGVCKREELFVTSKLWNTFHAPEHVEAACRRSLDDLGLDYLDLYLIHFPISLAFVPFSERYPPEWVAPGADGMKFAKVPVSSTWAAMEKLVEAGMVRDIGVSNWSSQGLRDLLSYCKIRPAVLQVLWEGNEGCSRWRCTPFSSAVGWLTSPSLKGSR